MTERAFNRLAAPLFDLGPGIRRDERVLELIEWV